MADLIKDDLVVLDKSIVPTDNFAVKIGDIYLPLFNREGSGFYLCSYVNRTYASYEFTVSGLSETLFADVTDWNGGLLPEQYRNINPNGTYTPYQQSADGVMNWRWKNENNCYCYYSQMQMGWVFTPIDDSVEVNIGISTFPVFASASWENTPYPWDSTLSWTDGSGTAVSFTLARVIPEPVERYWNGYRVRLSPYANKWYIDDEEHKLTYADFMPVAGRFYDAACSMEITNVNLSDDAFYSCPRDMTSHENNEWIVSADSEYQESSGKHRFAWKAFNGTYTTGEAVNNDWLIWLSQSDGGWLQWQCKTKKVIVNRIDIYYDRYEENCFKKPILYGSDDGSTWEEIGRIDATPPLTGEFRTYIFNNYKAFYYHKLVETSGLRPAVPLMFAYPVVNPFREVPE